MNTRRQAMHLDRLDRSITQTVKKVTDQLLSAFILSILLKNRISISQ
jgi:hypothetical protein